MCQNTTSILGIRFPEDLLVLADDEISEIPVIVIMVRAQNIDEALGLDLAETEDYITK